MADAFGGERPAAAAPVLVFPHQERGQRGGDAEGLPAGAVLREEDLNC